MLTYADEPTIKNAIIRRIDPPKGKKGERGLKVCEVKIEPHLLQNPPFIAVGVLIAVDSEHDGPIVRGVFHLPAVFEHAHLINEIDEIVDRAKGARIDIKVNGKLMRLGEQRTMLGTGLRGRWQAYG